jgi:hypothetical protein
VDPRHLRRRERRRDRRGARAGAGGRQRLGGVDDPPAAERDDEVGVDLVQERSRELVDETRADEVDAARGRDDARRRAPGALGGDERVALAEQPGRIGERAAAEPDRPRAVLPREVDHPADLTRGRGGSRPSGARRPAPRGTLLRKSPI